MSIALALAFSALGAIIASFMGVVAARLHTGESIAVGRSRCDACAAPVSPLALVPVLSYAFGNGKSFCCGVRLSLLSPISEFLLGALFAFSYMKLGLTPSLPLVWLSLSLLLALVLYDLAHQILPTPLLAAFVTSSALVVLAEKDGRMSTLITALILGGSLWLIHYFSHGRAMGFADAPLAFGLSLFAGTAALAGFICSFWIGAAIGIVVLLRRPRGSRMGIEVPFAPFLAAGYILAYFTQWNPLDLTALLTALF